MEPVPNRANDPRRGKFRSRQIADAQQLAAEKKAHPEHFRYRKLHTFIHPDIVGSVQSYSPIDEEEQIRRASEEWAG